MSNPASKPARELSWPLSAEDRAEIEHRARLARSEAFATTARAIGAALKAPFAAAIEAEAKAAPAPAGRPA